MMLGQDSHNESMFSGRQLMLYARPWRARTQAPAYGAVASCILRVREDRKLTVGQSELKTSLAGQRCAIASSP